MISQEQYEKAQSVIKQYEAEQAELLRVINPSCRLGRFPKDCSVFQYTTGKNCEKCCGHFCKSKDL